MTRYGICEFLLLSEKPVSLKEIQMAFCNYSAKIVSSRISNCVEIGYIKAEGEWRKKRYSITDQGRNYVENGMTPHQDKLYKEESAILRAIHEDKDISSTELAAKLFLGYAKMVKMLARLKKKGLIEVNKKHRRFFYRVTDEGLNYADIADTVSNQDLNRMFMRIFK